MRATTTVAIAIAAAAMATVHATSEPKMLGGWTPAEVTPAIKQTLRDALSTDDKSYGAAVGTTRVCYAKIARVETQVVAGTNYRFYIDGCTVGKTKLAGKCGAHGEESKCASPTRFVIRVFEQNWTDTLQVTRISKGDVESEPAALQEAATLDADATDDSSDDSNAAAMPETEKREVDAWIAANDLNEFGDQKHTMYTGGTPLFDERTGKSIDRYAYILRRHPDRPWRVQATVRANMFAAAVESSTTANSAVRTSKASQGLLSLIASVGVLTVLLALVAGVKAKRTRRHFAYDSVTNREI